MLQWIEGNERFMDVAVTSDLPYVGGGNKSVASGRAATVLPIVTKQ